MTKNPQAENGDEMRSSRKTTELLSKLLVIEVDDAMFTCKESVPLKDGVEKETETEGTEGEVKVPTEGGVEKLTVAEKDSCTEEGISGESIPI